MNAHLSLSNRYAAVQEWLLSTLAAATRPSAYDQAPTRFGGCSVFPWRAASGRDTSTACSTNLTKVVMSLVLSALRAQ